MDSNLIECELAERDTDLSGCKGPTLSVLKDVQRAYEQQMEVIERMPAARRGQMQVEVLRSWVSDLVGQNSLLARAVEELETEATNQLFRERRRHSEIVMELRAELCALRRRLARKDSDLRGLLEVLRRLREFDNCTTNGIHFYELSETDIFGGFELQKKKLEQGDIHPLTSKQDTTKTNREIRKLNKDVQQYEQTILSLRNEVSIAKYHTPDISKKDAEVMAEMCCMGAECGDWEPVKDFNALLREEMISYQERIHKMEANLKSSGNDVRALRSANVTLREELHGLRGVCAALAQQCRSHAMRDQFKDDIIREMRRQLKQAKAQSKEVTEVLSRSRSVTSQELAPPPRCVRAQPRGLAPHSLSDDCRSPRLVLSGDDLLSVMPD